MKEKCLTGWSCCIVINICFFPWRLIFILSLHNPENPGQKGQVMSFWWTSMIFTKKIQVCMGWPTPSWFGERYIFFALSRAWDKEKIQSHYEESNLRPLDSVLRCSNQWATETPLWARSIMTCILHTARIGNVESVMFVERIRRYGKFWAQ